MYKVFAILGLAVALFGCKQQSPVTQKAPLQPPAPFFGCAKDTDCKGDRICDNKVCVAPMAKQIAAQPAAPVEPTITAVTQSDAPAKNVAPDSNRSFEPGVNFGAVTRRTSEKALIDLYGRNNVKREAWYLGEGQYRAASAVLKGTKSEFWILWKNDKYTNAERVIVLGSAWRTSEGLRVGLPLDAVVKINGRNFLFYGFEWDYGGAVESWKRGRLSRFGDDMTVFLTRDFDIEADDATEQAVLGDRSVLSNTSGLEQLKIKVHKIEATL